MSLMCSKYLDDFPSYLGKAKVSTLARRDLYYLNSHYLSNLLPTCLPSLFLTSFRLSLKHRHTETFLGFPS